MFSLDLLITEKAFWNRCKQRHEDMILAKQDVFAFTCRKQTTTFSTISLHERGQWDTTVQELNYDPMKTSQGFRISTGRLPCQLAPCCRRREHLCHFDVTSSTRSHHLDWSQVHIFALLLCRTHTPSKWQLTVRPSSDWMTKATLIW